MRAASTKTVLLWAPYADTSILPLIRTGKKTNGGAWRMCHKMPTDKLRAFKSAYLLASSPADFNDYEEFSLILPDKFYGMLGFPSSKPCIRLAVMVSVRSLK